MGHPHFPPEARLTACRLADRRRGWVDIEVEAHGHWEPAGELHGAYVELSGERIVGTAGHRLEAGFELLPVATRVHLGSPLREERLVDVGSIHRPELPGRPVLKPRLPLREHLVQMIERLGCA